MDTQNSITNPDKTPERWLPIPGFEGYYDASDQGRIKTYWQKVGKGTGNGRGLVNVLGKPKILKPAISIYGYWVVTLCKNHVRSNFRVNRLILLAFVGPCPPGMEACHEDGKPTNNFLTNLRWDTHSSNQHDRRKHGTDYYPGAIKTYHGEESPIAKLTDDQVYEIRKLFSQGNYYKADLGRMFNITRTNIYHIVNRKTWTHLTVKGHIHAPVILP
jgi:hypothetical protein